MTSPSRLPRAVRPPPRRPDRHALDDFQAVAAQADDGRGWLVSNRIVLRAEVRQHLRAQAEVTQARACRARPPRRAPPSAARAGSVRARAIDIEEDPLARLLDHPQRHRRRMIVVARRRRRTRRAACRRSARAPAPARRADVAQHQRQVLRLLDVGRVDAGPELAGDAARRAGRIVASRDRVDQHLLAQAVVDQVGDRDDRQRVLARERLQVGHARHLAVLAHDLADRRRRARGRPAAPGPPILRCGPSAPARRPAAPCSGKTCPGVTMSSGPASRATATRTVSARSRAEMPVVIPRRRVDADRERGVPRRAVVGRHHRQAQLRDALLGQRQADEARAPRAP